MLVGLRMRSYLAVDALVVVIEDEPAVVTVLLLLAANLLGNDLGCQGNDTTKVVCGVEDLQEASSTSGETLFRALSTTTFCMNGPE